MHLQLIVFSLESKNNAWEDSFFFFSFLIKSIIFKVNFRDEIEYTGIEPTGFNWLEFFKIACCRIFNKPFPAVTGNLSSAFLNHFLISPVKIERAGSKNLLGDKYKGGKLWNFNHPSLLTMRKLNSLSPPRIFDTNFGHSFLLRWDASIFYCGYDYSC